MTYKMVSAPFLFEFEKPVEQFFAIAASFAFEVGAGCAVAALPDKRLELISPVAKALSNLLFEASVALPPILDIWVHCTGESAVYGDHEGRVTNFLLR